MSNWLTGEGAPDPMAGMREYLVQRRASEALHIRKGLCGLQALEQLRRMGRTPALPMEFTSQYGEDCWLWDLFRGQADGFFIEVGAFDGYTCSVSYPFEAMGWKGLLVEPIPECFARARERRPGSRVVNAALAGPGNSADCTFTVVDGGDLGMLSHLIPTGETTAEIRSARAATRSVTVPLTTMNDLLKDHKGPIDFAAIDVEGAEISLLQGFDLARFRPRVLMIEEGLPARTSPVMQYLAAFPYTPAAYAWINRVYIHNDEKELIRRATDIPVW